jgi:nitroimidazol reductase NimA-like FMN-containing flavoprotein (pyridoxamine 5'-phosphate oxidase superfamily)
VSGDGAGPPCGIPPDVEAFLAASGRGFLLTLRRDGSPTAHPMTALLSAGRLAYSTYRKSAKARNALRDPRTCSLVLGDYGSGEARAVVYKGLARELEPQERELPGRAGTEPARRLASSITSRAQERLSSGKRVLLGVEPREVGFLDRLRGS